MWDLKISEFQDLVYEPSRDFQTLSGTDLISQRILVRLKINQNSWIFDEDGTLGSNLYLALGTVQTRAMEQIPVLVEDALEPMSDDIDITDIQVRASEIATDSIDLFVEFKPKLELEQASIPLVEAQTLRLVIPLT